MKKILTGLVVLFMVIGCAGRTANPVMLHQYGDANKSCRALESELLFIQAEIARLVPKTQKTGKNVALGVTGWFFIVPLFFMDLSDAEQVEVNAYRQRYNHLVILAEEKNCGIVLEEPATEEPTAEAEKTED